MLLLDANESYPCFRVIVFGSWTRSFALRFNFSGLFLKRSHRNEGLLEAKHLWSSSMFLNLPRFTSLSSEVFKHTVSYNIYPEALSVTFKQEVFFDA